MLENNNNHLPPVVNDIIPIRSTVPSEIYDIPDEAYNYGYDSYNYDDGFDYNPDPVDRWEGSFDNIPEDASAFSILSDSSIAVEEIDENQVEF